MRHAADLAAVLVQGARAMCCACPAALAISAVPGHAEIGPNTFLVSVGETTGSGSAEIEAFGPGFGDLLVTDMLQLRETDPRFKDCDMAMLEWRRRGDILKERDLQQSGMVDPASVTVNGPLLDPQAMIEGTLMQNGTSVAWSITMRDRASGKVLATSEGSVPNEEIVDQSEKVARDMMEAACPPGWTASGGGPQITITGHVARLDASFQLTGNFPGGTAVFDYAPADASGGSVNYALSGGGVSGHGSGSFTLSPQEDGIVLIDQTTNGCIDGVANSCRSNSEKITLTPVAK